MTPFEVVYGRAPPTIHRYEHGTTAVAQVKNTLGQRDEILKQLRENLLEAQHRMKLYEDRHRRELEFQPGEMVYLKLQPFRQMSLRERGNMKFSPRFYGPYQIVEQLGKVAYRLELPTHSRLHPVFHVSQLKKKLGHSDRVAPELPKVGDNGTMVLEPKRIIDFRWVKNGKKVLHEALVQWVGVNEEDATWEPYDALQQQFSNLNLEDKIFLQGEGNVVSQSLVAGLHSPAE